MTPDRFLLVIALGLAVAQVAAVFAGWYKILQPYHQDLQDWFDETTTSAKSVRNKLWQLSSCPYCQAAWFALAAVLTAGEAFWLTAPVWGAAALFIKYQWE